MANKEQMKAEAVKRLEFLRENKGLMYPVVRSFNKKNPDLYYSERSPLGGILYWFREDNNVNPEWIKLVKDFEEESGELVYHITHEYTSFGELLDLFIVSDDEDYWEEERERLYDGYAYCYVINLTEPSFSEYGTIGYKVLGGGIVRTA